MKSSFFSRLAIMKVSAYYAVAWLLIVISATIAGCSKERNNEEGMGRFETTEATVTAMASGELTMFNVAEGQQVEKGMVLGMIEDTQLLMQREELHSSLQQIESDRRMVVAKRESAKQRLDELEKQSTALRQQIADVQQEKAHYEDLYEKGVVARNQVESFDVRLDMLEKQLAVLEEQIGSTVTDAEDETNLSPGDADLRAGELEAQIAQIDHRLTGIQVASPVAGTIIEKHAMQGDYVTAGDKLFRVADLTNMTLRVTISAETLSHLKLGQKVKVAVDAGKGNPLVYDGTVTWVSQYAEFGATLSTKEGSTGGMHGMKISVVNDGKISIGMSGRLILE